MSIKNILDIKQIPAPGSLCFSLFNIEPKWSNRLKVSKLDTALFFIELVKILARILLEFGHNIIYRLKSNIKNNVDVVFILGSINHCAVFEMFSKYVNVSYDVWGKAAGKGAITPYEDISINFRDILSLSSYLIQQYRGFNKAEKTIIHKRGYLVFVTYIRLIKYMIGLKDSDLKLLVVFNDHGSWYRSLVYAAKYCKIRTLYIPHASVSKLFPPLIFDYTFCEGVKTYNNYVHIGINSAKIELLGNVKFDNLKPLKNKGGVIRIGIAYNMSDNIAHLKKLINKIYTEILRKYSNNVFIFCIRPHPAQQESIKIERPYIEYSDPVTERSTKYLNSLNLLFSTDSNIALESLLMGVPVINITSEHITNGDNYGFVEDGLINAGSTKLSYILDTYDKNYRDSFQISDSVRDKLKDYNCAIGTINEGSVAPIIASRIDELVNL
jgi:hypothetical protein